MAVRVINLAEKFAAFKERWSPKIVADLNESHVKLAKLQGEFVWHRHENEDELFLVTSGVLRMRVREDGRERELLVGPGELIVIPRGMEHLPVGDDEVHVVLVEPKTTLNTGNVRNERTRDELERL